MAEGNETVNARRLYRGLTRKYRPGELARTGICLTDFTDCPVTALQYAPGRYGVVLVADVPEGRVFEALWLVADAKRFSVHGRFDQFLAGIVQAKGLRKMLRMERLAASPRQIKASVLERFIEVAVEAKK